MNGLKNGKQNEWAHMTQYDVDKLGFFDLFKLTDIPKQTSSDWFLYFSHAFVCLEKKTIIISLSCFCLKITVIFCCRGSHIFLARLGMGEDGE